MTHVLMTYPGLIPSVLLCGQFQLQFLADAGKIEFRSIQRDALTPEDCGWADVMFLVRSDSELENALAEECKKKGKRLVYVLDDDLLQVPVTNSSSRFYQQETVRENIRKMLDLCDVFLSPSEELQKKYGYGKVATIEEPAIRVAKDSERPAGPVRIGFAGSIDRAHDLDTLLSSVIESLLERYSTRIAVEFFGARPQIAERCNLRWIPYCDSYEEYQKTMESLHWDIGLAPMPETPFHACKHYNKFIEYAGYGIAGVYSDVIPYTSIVRSGENGLLCANTSEAWINALSQLIDDDALRAHITQTARRQAQTDFSVTASAQALEKELGNLLTYAAPEHNPVALSFRLRTKIRLHRIWSAFRHYGFRFPLVTVKKLGAKSWMKRESKDA